MIWMRSIVQIFRSRLQWTYEDFDVLKSLKRVFRSLKKTDSCGFLVTVLKFSSTFSLDTVSYKMLQVLGVCRNVPNELKLDLIEWFPLHDWLKNRPAPLFHPIRNKIKTNCDLLALVFTSSFDLTNWRQFFMRLSHYWSWNSSWRCQSNCGSVDYFDNVMTKFIVNNCTDALKTALICFFRWQIVNLSARTSWRIA